jgi:hypothetical protein
VATVEWGETICALLRHDALLEEEGDERLTEEEENDAWLQHELEKRAPEKSPTT